MKKLLKNFNRLALKEDARKLGVNLITASIVGGFVTHLTDMSALAITFLVWVGFLGMIFWIFGLYKTEETNKNG